MGIPWAPPLTGRVQTLNVGGPREAKLSYEGELADSFVSFSELYVQKTTAARMSGNGARRLWRRFPAPPRSVGDRAALLNFALQSQMLPIFSCAMSTAGSKTGGADRRRGLGPVIGASRKERGGKLGLEPGLANFVRFTIRPRPLWRSAN